MMLHYISVDHKGGCNVYREGPGRAGDQKGSCDFQRQSLRTTRMTDAYRGSLKTIR